MQLFSLEGIAPATPDVGELAKATAQLQEAGLELPTCDEFADGGRSHSAFVERTPWRATVKMAASHRGLLRRLCLHELLF